MHLLSSTWARALNIIRKKSVRYQHLGSLSGAEADEWEYEKIAAIFNKDKTNNYYSKAEAYLQGRTDRSPLQDREPEPTETQSNFGTWKRAGSFGQGKISALLQRKTRLYGVKWLTRGIGSQPSPAGYEVRPTYGSETHNSACLRGDDHSSIRENEVSYHEHGTVSSNADAPFSRRQRDRSLKFHQTGSKFSAPFEAVL
ncbi:hypothetical protein BDZ45DRAFT_748108 [Acephala macrosclerotiorum]|nr:hypothetical protein BDZ45DRAFT_748108 [Acephala macrosclerotiorum]